MLACPDCDLLYASAPLPPGTSARCVRCGSALPIPARHAQTTWIALTIAALIAFAVANAEPLMQLSELGMRASLTLAESAALMWLDGSETAAVLVVVCSIAAPAGYLLTVLAALLATRRAGAPRWSATLVRWALALHDWAMPEIVLLGTLIAFVKMRDLADASPGPGMAAIGALVLLIAWLNTSIDWAALWSRIPCQA